MHSGLVVCKRTATLGEVAALLTQHHVHAAVVVDSGGEAVGVISDTDLLAGEWLATDDQGLAIMRSLTAGELMTSPPATVLADAPAEEVAMRLRSAHISRLLVAEDGQPVGVVAVSDLVVPLGRPSGRREVVADVMSWGIVTCRDQAPVGAVARAMHERRSRSIVVVDATGSAIGVVTGFDLLGLYGDSAAANVSELMKPPQLISPRATLRECADRMLEREVHRLVVVDPDKEHQIPLGVVSTMDIVAEMADPGSIWRT